MTQLSTYLPEDRLRALALGVGLPDRTCGSALFADISGFTQLTETLTHKYGQRRGIEELITQVNTVYNALITEIERYDGSVINFAGDSMTCWFGRSLAEASLADPSLDDRRENDGVNAVRAVRAGLGMQAAMKAFPRLGLKVAVTSGPARRFVVGDPRVQYLDTLAGTTIARLAAGEHLASRGEVLADTATIEALKAAAPDAAPGIRERRTSREGEQFAVVEQFNGQAPSSVYPPIPDVDVETLRSWVLPAIFTREQGEHGLFLTELRPAVALFLRFTGIDYDGDDQAGQKLDSLIRQVQAVLARYEGSLMDLTIGDKGSYLYANFGAPLVHEDDARRAVQASMELQSACAGLDFLAPVQIGLSQGVMRCGAYGGVTRRTYGALGDDANLAARLMTTAAPGEILLSGRVRKVVSDLFSFEPRPPLPLKGKAEPVNVFAVTGQRHQRAIRLEEPHYALPMMGRQAELSIIDQKLDLALQGRGQVISIVAEAGMGKSRLVAEAIRLSRKKGFTGYGGACEASGTNTSYLVWKPIWQAFFGLDSEAPLRRQLRILEGEIEDRSPERVEALPVLSVLLDLPIEENEFTRSLEPKDRRNVLIALLEDCLKSAAAEEPVLLVLEDVHWMDALSHDLLETLARVSANLPVCFVLAYRPPDQVRLQAERVESLEHFTPITLSQLSPAEAEGLIRAKLAQLFPEHSGSLPQALVDELTCRAEGNPFYIEELLNYLRDRGINPYDASALSSLDLPASLHALILSRMDRLSEAQQVALKSASIIGRSFRLNWLQGYYPALGTAERVKADLEELARIDLTPLDTPEPELAYLFKHIVTLEVAYESLPHATRTLLHEQLAHYIETLDPDRYLDLLAFHYGLSKNTEKQRKYFQKAGEAAQAASANDAALAYYERLLPLLPPGEQIAVQMRRGAIYELMGQYTEAEAALCSALERAENIGEPAAAAASRLAVGKLCRQRGEYQLALDWLEEAQEGWAALGDPAGLGRVLCEIGAVCWRQGEYERAHRHLKQALAWAEQAGNRRTQAQILTESGTVMFYQGDYAAAKTLFEQALSLQREINEKQDIASSLHNLGSVAYILGDPATAQTLYEQGLAMRREIGDKVGIAGSLINLGNVVYGQGNYAAARAWYEESLTLEREIGDKRGIAIALGNLGNVAYGQGDYAGARDLYEQSLSLRREIGDKQGVTMVLVNLGLVVYALDNYTEARKYYEQSLAMARETGDKTHAAYALLGLGLTTLAEAGDSPAAVQAARQQMQESLAIRQQTGQQYLMTSSLVGLAGAAMRLGDAHRAARLLGCVSAALRALEAVVEPDVLEVYQQALSDAQAALDATDFQAAWMEGESLPLEAVTAEELAE